MTFSEIRQNLKAIILGSKYDKSGEGVLELVHEVKAENQRIDLSIFVHIAQKKCIDQELKVVLAKQSSNGKTSTVSTLNLFSISLDPEEGKLNNANCERGELLSCDQYKIIQNVKLNGAGIPVLGTGTYALILLWDENDLDTMLDTYYFRVV